MVDVRTKSLSMLERASTLREERLPSLREELQEIKAEAQQYETRREIPNSLVQEFERKEAEIERTEGEADTLEHYAQKWENDVFVIQELTVGTVGKIQDDVAEASNASFDGGGTPKMGYSRQRTLEAAITDSPSQAPEPADLPDAVGDWLFECVDELGSTGDVSMGNSSSRDRLIDTTMTGSSEN